MLDGLVDEASGDVLVRALRRRRRRSLFPWRRTTLPRWRTPLRRWRRALGERPERALERKQLLLELAERPGDVGVHGAKRTGRRGSAGRQPGSGGGGARQEAGAAAPPRTSTAISAASVGVRPTRTPRASSASAFAAAVPAEPETIAPAWPICLPAGAVKPAM
jgi:hypothetical protein